MKRNLFFSGIVICYSVTLALTERNSTLPATIPSFLELGIDHALETRDGIDSNKEFGEASHTQLDNQPWETNQSIPEINARKCCRRNEAFVESQRKCAPYDVIYNIPVYDTAKNVYRNVSSKKINFVEGLLTECAPSILEADEFIFFDTGEIFSPIIDEYFYPNKYCLEHLIDDISNPANDSVRLTAAYCPNNPLPDTFDPVKIAVRKCCSREEIVASNTSECLPRAFVTSKDWVVPVKSMGELDSSSENFTSSYEIFPGYPECMKMERGESLDFSQWGFEVFKETGYLSIPKLGLSTLNYCIDEYENQSTNEISRFAYVCLDEKPHKKFLQATESSSCKKDSTFCVAKCCPLDQLLLQDGSCVDDKHAFANSQPFPIRFRNGSVEAMKNVDFNFGAPPCEQRGFFLTKLRERGTVMEEGTLHFVSYDETECGFKAIEHIPQEDYCYELIKYQDSEGFWGLPVSGALICYPKYDKSEAMKADRVNYVYSTFLVLSDIFILISFVIYLTIPDQAKRGLNKNIKLGHSVLGRIILRFLFSLFFAYLCLIIQLNASDQLNMANINTCKALGIIMYISFLATFFWLNALCFELWWKCARQERTSGRRWIWYQFYAWGVPLLLGAGVLYIEFSPNIGPCFPKPNFGLQTCFFSDTRTFGSTAKWLYMNIPIAILLITDLAFFLMTTKSLMKTVEQSHAGTAKRQARQRMKLCFKLFLVMGICWMTEIISTMTGSSKWYISEAFNCLQGFVIFLIFILKPKIIHAVKEKLRSYCTGTQTPKDPLRNKLTFTASVLSDFISSTKQPNNPSHSYNTPSNSSFSTASSHVSWSVPMSNQSTDDNRCTEYKKGSMRNVVQF